MMKFVFSYENRRELLEFFTDEKKDEETKSFLMKYMSIMEEENRGYNWYQGYSSISLPALIKRNYDNFETIEHLIESSASNGTVQTEFWGETYDIEKIEKVLALHITLFTPQSFINENTSLSLEIEKLQLFIKEYDPWYEYGMFDEFNLDDDVLDWRNYDLEIQDLADRENISISLRRMISKEGLYANTKFLKNIPGFKVKWRYNQNLESEKRFYDDWENMEFRRFVNMVNGKELVEVWSLAKYFKSYVAKNIFCQGNMLVEFQTKLVLQFMEFALEKESNYDVVDGTSKENLNTLGIF